jgi:hypothetical protein
MTSTTTLLFFIPCSFTCHLFSSGRCSSLCSLLCCSPTVPPTLLCMLASRSRTIGSPICATRSSLLYPHSPCSSFRQCVAPPVPSHNARRPPAKPRPVLLVLDGGGARAPPLATGSHPNDRNRPAPAFPSPMLQTYVLSVSNVS